MERELKFVCKWLRHSKTNVRTHSAQHIHDLGKKSQVGRSRLSEVDAAHLTSINPMQNRENNGPRRRCVPALKVDG